MFSSKMLFSYHLPLMNGSNFRAVRQVPKCKETPSKVYTGVRKGALIAFTFGMSALSVDFGS
jgi:hypothetical protein